MSTVFLKILNMSITASWLILAVVLVRLLLKKAPKWIPCLLWGLVAIRLVCPFSFGSIFSLIPSNETIPTNITVQQEPAINSGITIVNDVINPVIAESFTPAPTDSVNPLQIIIPVAAIVWVSGIVIMLAYALISYIKLKKTVSVCVPVGERILSCDEVKAPFILGVFKPIIYVPSSMSGETLDLVIRHETAHLQRRDHWWKPFGYLLLAFYWFNPLCWIAYVLLCRDIEMACDEKVIRDMDRGDKAAYSQALLDCSFPRKRIAACPLAFGEVGVKERIRGVLNYKKPAFWIVLTAVAACVVLAVCLMTDPFPNRSLSGKLGVSMDMAVAEHNHDSETDGHFVAIDYDVLRVSKSLGRTTVYAWVMYEEYSFDGTDVKEETGSHIPTVITFDTSSEDSDRSAYDVIEYWEPRDGNYYPEDIRSKFPLGIRAKAFDVSGADSQHQNCLRAAREYFGLFYTEKYSLNDGRYVLSESDDASIIPYLLINNGRFTIVQDVAVSYQPSGTIERSGNIATMKTVYAGETYIWVFELIGHDQVKFHLGDSEIPVNRDKWEDEMVFTRVQEREAEIDMDSLRAKYPEYFDLSTFKGLELYVWQMAPDSYSCGLMLGTNRNKTLEELMNLKGATIAEMRAIISSYDIAKEDIFIIPWQNPVSSYMAEYWIREKDEDPSSVEKRQQEYINGIRHMLFDTAQNGGYDLPDSIADTLYDLRPMILVDGVIFMDTGKALAVEVDPSAVLGEITSSVAGDKRPTEDGQSNFECVGSQYAYFEDGLVVLIHNEWWLFEREDPSISKDGGVDSSENIIEEIQTTVAYVNYTEGGMMRDCLNGDKMIISSVRHLPVYKFDTLEELNRFKESYKDILTFDQGYDEVPSFNEVTAAYGESFFADHTVVLAYVEASSGSFRYAVRDISCQGSALCLDVEQTNHPEVYTDDMSGWFVIAEVLDSDIAAFTEFDAQLLRDND
ncbi:MAG: hypothetical protein IKH56_08015 [Oscillospiraceae bacterium]|nr:hypothetical protein [Oscillospiraceae bacterium]